RGGGPDQTLVLLDKVTVYNPTHAFGFFSSFNADALDEVNLYKGAYPAEHGGRLGAVLDVRSREGNTTALAGQGGVSTIASRLQMDGPLGGGTWMASARRTHLDPFLDAVRTEENEIPAYYFYDLNARVTVPAAGGKMSLSGYKGRDDLRFDLESDTYIDLNWGNALLTASYRRTFNESVVAEMRVAGTEYESETDLRIFSTPIGITNRIREVTGAGEVTWGAGRGWQLTGGAVASRYQLEYFQEFNGERQVDYYRTPWEGAAFGEAQWTPRRGTVLLGGVRARYLDDGERGRVEPRWSASQRLGERWRLKLGGGVYYQYLQLVSTEGFSAADFYVPIDETAPPGRSVQTVLGVEWTPSAQWQLSVEGYYTELADVVQFNTDVSGDSENTDAADLFYTGGEGYASGVEFFVQKRRGDFTGWVGYTLGWTRRKFPDLNQGESFPPKYDRRHDLSVVGQYRRGKWTFGGNFVLASGQAFTPAAAVYGLRNPATGTLGDPILLPAPRNSARLLPYHRLDLSVNRGVTWFGQSFEWFIQVFNVYSRRNEWFVQYNLDDAVAEPDVVRMLPIVPSLGINVEF
ncbi:MAG: TonB-dependent receptor plug domain-containing protein, partial [Gemmatimonadales bacterium]